MQGKFWFARICRSSSLPHSRRGWALDRNRFRPEERKLVLVALLAAAVRRARKSGDPSKSERHRNNRRRRDNPFESGGASTGQALVALPEEIRRAVREEVRRELFDTGGQLRWEAETRSASGRR